ncbi:DEAD/DEAH box helicase [Aureimonas leprariae]|uniref:DEAD/DEAH box helicase n=1 Tax=Plantimonas leprariae TaxID=2615207 RepID=A0A7V7TVP3_9HYPH|nr:DEAD/DEAH box helicase [Aureimonas leprariae]KAB0678451.1 DEAD/DEAH box helicase [Aureimonas leprariae]
MGIDLQLGADGSLSPLAIDRRLRERVTEAVIAQGGLRHAELNAFLRERLAGDDVGKGALFAEPALEGAAGFVSSGRTPADLAGSLLHHRLVSALTHGEPGEAYRFDYPVYAHQLEAWEHLLAPDRRSVLVSSGTGSGKTECFLVPMLDDLAREAERSGRLSGVYALMLYPLNALIASQEERLRRWIAPFDGDIRFGLFNGLMLDRRKRDRDRDEAKSPEQVFYRTTLRSDPPPVLVTNNTMLEYMTIRKEDQPIIEASRGKLRWIVIDEAHSYVGSAAAEVSLLLRRVLQAFGVEAKDVRFVATSATIGGRDEAAKSDLQRYLADLAGVPSSQVRVVLGAREDVTLPPPSRSTALSAADFGTRAFAANPVVQRLVREAEAGPVPLARAAELAAVAGIDVRSLVEAVAGSSSRAGGGPLLPLRVHKFVRAVPGLWSCLDPACTGAKTVDWPFGGLAFERSDACPACQGPLFEIVGCRECGEPWLDAFDHGDRLRPAALAPDADEFAAASARETDEASEEDEEPRPPAPGRAKAARRLIATRALPGLSERIVDPRTGVLPERKAEGAKVWMSRVLSEERCPHCNAKPSRAEGRMLWPFRFGAPFLIQNAAPTMLDGVKPSERRNVELPAEGRQLLSFTDSRQGTARFAANVETLSERSFVRAFVYHLVQKAAKDVGLTDERRTELHDRRAKFARYADDFADEIQRIDDELAGASEPKPVRWTDAVKALASEPMVKQWIGSVWDADRDERFRDAEKLANFLLLRELNRRPRRANAIETLGMAKLGAPELEKLGPASLPAELRNRGFSIGNWRDFLYFLLDGVVRNNFVLSVNSDDARWFLPRKSFLRSIVGPDREKRTDSDVTWPKASARAGSKPNAVLVLERVLAMDAEDGEGRAVINDLLRAAWTRIEPLLSGSGSTFALNFERIEIAPVSTGWLCPVTHRVLPRLLFGRTPYGVRGNPPGAAQAPEPLRFPRLPTAFPRNPSERAELAAFVQDDPTVASLRATGVWTNLHDRAATLAPYIRAEEHSAQQPPHRLREFEAQFKEGEINLLACSTTMEMGVDIGSVEAVLNTNVPPSIANYRQRVGRAGRRRQSFASSLTFARDTPLDREAFRDPVRYLGRQIRAPQVRLDSRRIVQRHVNALLLAGWFRQAKGELDKVKVGTFFGFPENLSAEPDADPPVQRFGAWLRQPSTAAACREPLDRLTAGTALAGSGQLASRAAEMFALAADAFGSQWSTLAAQAQSLAPDARRGLELQLRRMCREPLLKELSARSLLPGHGFPNAVVPFINDCKDNEERQRRREDEGETSRNRRYDYPSRNADVAIREYAPGAEVVIDGLVWTSAGVTLNWERPAHEAKAREIQSIRWSWVCRACGETGGAHSKPEDCPACGADELSPQQFLEPAGFRVDWRSRPHNETDTTLFIEPQPARISARGARWEPLLDPALGRARASADGRVFHCSLGAARQGYRVCLDCGRAEEESDAALRDHDALMPVKGNLGRCPGNDRKFARTAPLALGCEVLTDVAEMQPAALAEEGTAWAFASALREALARGLGIETREIGLGVERKRNLLGAPACSVFLFDATAGGAGYAPRLIDDPVSALKSARDILDCPAQCLKGCSACVLVPDLHARQEIVDRRAALAFVESLLGDLADPPPDDVAVPGAELCPPVADALVRRLAEGGTVTIWAHEEIDIAALAQPPLSTLLGAAGRSGAAFRVVLAPDRLAALDDAARAGLRDASHRHRFTLVSGEPPVARNGALLLAAHESATTTKGFFSRDRGAAVLGASWGSGSLHPAVAATLTSLPSTSPVDASVLERSVRPGDRVRVIAQDPERSARLFGTSFLQRLLRPELEAAGLWKPGRLASIGYSDRYLKAPLPVLLLLRVAAALKSELGAKTTAIPLTLVTEPLRDDRLGLSSRRLFHDWQKEADRSATIRALARDLGFDCRYADGGASHGRKLTIGYSDGSAAIVLFDQGFGYWRSTRQDDHPFRASPAEQARSLINSSVLVGGNGDSYFAVTRAEGPT